MSNDIKTAQGLQNTQLYKLAQAAVTTAHDKEKFNNISIFDTDNDGTLSAEELKKGILAIQASNRAFQQQDKYKGVQNGVQNKQESVEAFDFFKNSKWYDWTGKNGDNQKEERNNQVKNNQRDAESASRIILGKLSEKDLDKIYDESQAAAVNWDKYSQAAATKQELSNIQTYDDIDNLEKAKFSIFNPTDTDEVKQASYIGFAQEQLKSYDTNGDGVVTVEEFAAKEGADAKKSADLTAGHLGGYTSEEEQQKAEAGAQNMGNLFAKNLDINGDGIISAEELAYLEKVADGLDGKKDGEISVAAESEMFGAITGMNADNKDIRTVVNKYFRGEELTEQEQQILEQSTLKIRSGIRNHAKQMGFDV